MMKPFNRVERKVERFYLKKGKSPKVAREWGIETAGKIAHLKAARVKNHIPEHMKKHNKNLPLLLRPWEIT